MDGVGFKCRACSAENSGLEFTTTYCLMLLTKELGAMNIGIKHQVVGEASGVAVDLKPENADFAADVTMADGPEPKKRVATLDDVFG